MYKNNCKCGGLKFYLQYKGPMVGKYCSSCNKWQRWVSKKDIDIYRANSYVIFKEELANNSYSNSGKSAVATPFKPCAKCNGVKFYLRYKGEMVGKYCTDCDRWSSWVGKKVLDDLKISGYTVKDESYINIDIVKSVNIAKERVTTKSCPKCSSIEFYVKERGTNTGQYCVHCNKWIKWLSKLEVRSMQCEGLKVHTDTYLSHRAMLGSDSNNMLDDTNRYVNHSDVYVTEYHKSIGAIVANTSDNSTRRVGVDGLAADTIITKKENCTVKKDTRLVVSELPLNNCNINILQNEANIFLLEKFISNTPKNCVGCSLEEKCDIVVVKLCDSIKDAIEFLEDGEIWT